MATTWSSTTPSLESEIILIGDDASLETGGNLHDLLLPWTNRIVLEICNELLIRKHLTNGDVSVSDSVYKYDMLSTAGSVYFRQHERWTKVRIDDEYIDIVGLEELNAQDPDHDETTTSTPTCVAIEGNYLYVYPMYTGTLTVEGYLREPVAMSATTDSPDIPVELLRNDLIIAGVVGKYVFPNTGENQKALLWYNRSNRTGKFFELLHEYKNYLNSSDKVWTNLVKYY